MAGRIYRVPFVASTVTAAGGNTDLWEIIPADDKPCRIVGIRLGQISEVADAAEEGLDLTIVHLGATVTSGNGTAVTPVPADPAISDLAAGFAAEINGATVATTSGTTTIVEAIAWNNRNTPLEIYWPDERFYPTVRQASALVVRMNTTLADDMTFVGCLFVEEQ
jgi:hypothetical protein